MIYTTATVLANRPGQTPLSRMQARQVLVRKARDACIVRRLIKHADIAFSHSLDPKRTVNYRKGPLTRTPHHRAALF